MDVEAGEPTTSFAVRLDKENNAGPSSADVVGGKRNYKTTPGSVDPARAQVKGNCSPASIQD